MSKVTPKETTDLTTVNPTSLIPTATDMDEGFKAPSSGNYLPFLEMVFPVMVTPETPFLKGKEYTLGFKDGAGFQSLPEGTVLTVVDKRNSVRVKSTDADGKVKNTYGYQAIERKGNRYEKSTAFYNVNAPKDRTDPSINAGYSMVIIALLPDGRSTVLDFSAYKTMTGYMYPALSPANLPTKIGLKLEIGCHDVNLKKSATGMFYPDAKKFKQWSHVQLNSEQLTRAVEAINIASEGYMNWLER